MLLGRLNLIGHADNRSPGATSLMLLGILSLSAAYADVVRQTHKYALWLGKEEIACV